MKYYWIILIASINVLSTLSQSSPQEENIKKIGLPQFIIIENIINLAGNDCSTRKKSAINRSKHDAIYCLSELPIANSYCQFLMKDLMKCVRPLVEIIEQCNKGTIFEGFIRAFVGTTFSQNELVCDTDGEQIFELLNPCLFRSLELKEPCVNTFVTEVQTVARTNEKLLNVTCQAAASAKKCLESTVESECSNNSTRNTVLEIYNAAITPCNISDVK